MSNQDDESRKVDTVWINTRELAERTRGMSARQIGQLLVDILDLAKRGRMRNGPVVRIDPPGCLEDK
jgi:hypothetical protein